MTLELYKINIFVPPTFESEEYGVCVGALTVVEGSITPTIFGGSLMQADTAAEARELLKTLKTVYDFGVVGDGATDDTAAFLAAHASGEVIIIPDGSYYITQHIVSPNNFITLGVADWTHASNYRVFTNFNIFGNMRSRISDSMTAGREELQIYANSLGAFSTGSKGSGIHLYGNGDAQHAGNIAFMTGQDDNGQGRIIVSGGSNNPSSDGYRTNTDTRVTIGNSIFDWVDEKNDIGMLNLKSPSGRPAVYFYDSATDLATTYGSDFVVAQWDGTTTINSFKYSSSSGLRAYDNIAGHDNTKFAMFRPVYDGTNAYTEIRGDQDMANGAGINLFSASDPNGSIIRFYAGGDVRLQINATGTYAVRAGADNTQSLGTASTRWGTVYAGTGTINTSDARLKTGIRSLSDDELAVADELSNLIQAYKFRDAVEEKGELARTHIGIIAQDVICAFEKYGLNAMSYGIVCYDKWPDEAIEGKLIAGGDRYGIRYEELLAMIVLANSQKMGKIEQRLAALEAK